MYILELLKKNSENYEIIAEPGESFEKKDEILKRMKGYCEVVSKRKEMLDYYSVRIFT